MSSLSAVESLSGSVSVEQAIKGTISSGNTLIGAVHDTSDKLSGELSICDIYAQYDGQYEVTPSVYEQQELETANKVLKENIKVLEVPFYATSNDANGVTAYIGKDVQNGI